ncbi:hypothetical protein WL1483_328 [Aeromonas schubertii]|uniref:Uncharacterized protein n=1 Tax=Aeromonas schubertii TaxID=652 RepID=A0A0S2SDH1_9GAMM|nr:hypothetical protein WL1483_328 [Aeromonas schubertii]
MAGILMRLRRMGHEGSALDIFSPAHLAELSQAPEPMASSLMRRCRIGISPANSEELGQAPCLWQAL